MWISKEKDLKIELWLYKSIGLGIYEKIETKRQNRYIKLLYNRDKINVYNKGEEK